LLDRVSVLVARRKVHRGKRAAAAQVRIDDAHTFEQLCPIDIGN
jgi:hypothetical protein